MTTNILALGLLAPGTANAADVIAASALGDELGDAPHALAIDVDGDVIVAGAHSLVRLDDDGEPVGEALRVLGGVDDIAIDEATGNVVIAGPSELRVLSPELAPLWRRSLDGTTHRLGIGEHGTIAVTVAGGLEVVAPTGELLAHVDTLDHIAALAVLDAAQLVVTTGSPGDREDAATLAGFGLDGAPHWRAWDDREGSRGVDVVRGEDGLVYALAEIDGESEHVITNVGFDATTTRTQIGSAQFAYYARVSPNGELMRGQYLGFADELSVVQPLAIAATRDGSVHVLGSTTHGIEDVPDDADVVEALGAPVLFHQIIAPDFDARQSWGQHDVAPVASAALALAPAHAVALLHDDANGGTVVALPRAPQHYDKKPEREDVGTFGYESGVAGSDPTCYCDAQPRKGALGWLALVVLAVRRRR
ncbi:MAG TPA: hypothetical protein VG755_08650 [Nannocystaceae bacterium]|nr:hypothetical protein [Nannocystaceae bacterium]